MKLLKNGMLTAALLMGGFATTYAQSVDEIMDKHEKAMGGLDNWNKVKTMKMVGAISAQGMDINITQTTEVGKASRMDMSVMGMNGFQIVTDKEGWMYMPMAGNAKVEPMKPEQVKASQRQLDVRGNQMLDYKLKGTKAELAGTDTLNSSPCYKVKFTDKDKKESVCYIDMKTYYIMRTEMKAEIQGQEQEISVDYKDYQKNSEGIVLPMAMSIPMMGMTADINYKSIEINKPVDASVFKPEIKK